MEITSLYRYPVKGLSPERLEQVALRAGEHWPGDRLYAIENGPSGFDPDAPIHQPKMRFLMLMRNEALAKLRSRYLDETTELVIEGDGISVRAALTTREGRLAVEAFFRKVVPREMRGAPKVLFAPEGFRFTDSRVGFVSIINLASVDALGKLVGRPVDPLRFRGNILIDGIAPWAEFDLVGQTIGLAGGPTFAVTKRIVRCAATEVDPATGARDMPLPKVLMARLGHMDFGVYADITAPGILRPGDRLGILREGRAAGPTDQGSVDRLLDC